MVTRRLRAFAIASSIGMLLVLLAGALVTKTESGRGCGDDWPLCNGKFIPAYTMESMIEYSHRVVSAVEGFLVLGVAIAVFLKYRTNRDVFREPLYYAGFALLFTIIQALMGAAAVMWPQSPPILAIHFGISIIAFAATFLLVIWMYRTRNGLPEAYRVPGSIMPRALATSLFCYVVIYLGAYIRHTDTAGGCQGWPLCNGQVVPDLTGTAGPVFIHRVAAVILTIMIAELYFHILKLKLENNHLQKTSGWVLGLVLLQIWSGAFLTWTIGNENIYIFSNLLHNLIIVFLFGYLLDVLITSWRLKKRQ